MGGEAIVVLGRNHPILRRVRALRRDATARRSEGLIVAEGVHLAQEALRSGASIEGAIVSPRLSASAEGRSLLEAFSARGITVDETSDELLDAAQDSRSAQPVLCLVRRSEPTDDDLAGWLAGDAPVVLAHGIQDPGNLGTVLRTADAAGCAAVLTCGPCADLGHPRTVRAGMGATFRIPAARVALREAPARLHVAGYRLLGADPRAALPYWRAGLDGQVAVVLGGEAAGLPPELREALDECCAIPMRAGVESLSVGAAAAVLLFEAARRRITGAE